MTAISQAIKIAVEEGWKPKNYYADFSAIVPNDAFLDPEFWGALGKGLGWKDDGECPLACCGGICPIEIPMSQSHAHRFLDHIFSGKSAGEYFESIIKEKL